MHNYEYIIASLPDIAAGWKFGEKTPKDYIGDIEELCDQKDRELIEFLRGGLEGKDLNAAFYEKALAHRNSFIREYFAFDLNLRNAKVRYLNKALSRPADKDTIILLTAQGDVRSEQEGFEEGARLDSILAAGDILSRERGLDDLMWDKIDLLTTFNYFDINKILAFIAKLNIVARWFKLDEQSGRELFKKLVDEVRGTFKGVEYNA
ncbi:MAG: DUF2764 family protein [Candidatus Cryptobacteroides sp.]